MNLKDLEEAMEAVGEIEHYRYRAIGYLKNGQTYKMKIPGTNEWLILMSPGDAYKLKSVCPELQIDFAGPVIPKTRLEKFKEWLYNSLLGQCWRCWKASPWMPPEKKKPEIVQDFNSTFFQKYYGIPVARNENAFWMGTTA